MANTGEKLLGSASKRGAAILLAELGNAHQASVFLHELAAPRSRATAAPVRASKVRSKASSCRALPIGSFSKRRSTGPPSGDSFSPRHASQGVWTYSVCHSNWATVFEEAPGIPHAHRKDARWWMPAKYSATRRV